MLDQLPRHGICHAAHEEVVHRDTARRRDAPPPPRRFPDRPGDAFDLVEGRGVAPRDRPARWNGSPPPGVLEDGIEGIGPRGHLQVRLVGQSPCRADGEPGAEFEQPHQPREDASEETHLSPTTTSHPFPPLLQFRLDATPYLLGLVGQVRQRRHDRRAVREGVMASEEQHRLRRTGPPPPPPPRVARGVRPESPARQPASERRGGGRGGGGARSRRRRPVVTLPGGEEVPARFRPGYRAARSQWTARHLHLPKEVGHLQRRREHAFDAIPQVLPVHRGMGRLGGVFVEVCLYPQRRAVVSSVAVTLPRSL